ncbi:MAG: isopeptide-forming domain-containing fimbrial protein [Planctomycetota bacterium]
MLKGFRVTAVGVFGLILVLGGLFPRCAQGMEPLSQYTTTTFNPDGEILEFVDFAGNPQEFFFPFPPIDGSFNFGAVKHEVVMTRGVFMTRDNSPTPGAINSAGQTGFRDAPCASGIEFIPTGFNIGRVFAAYNPKPYGGMNGGAYYLAMDISAPGAMDGLGGTQPTAFDVDGDGSTFFQTEPQSGIVTEAPTSISSPDVYAIELNTDQIGKEELTILFFERRGAGVPSDAVAIDPECCGDPINCCAGPRPVGCPATAQVINGFCVRRYVRLDDATGLLDSTPGVPLDARDRLRFFLDADDNGVLNFRDIGVGPDIEFVIRNVGLLPNITPTCCTFNYVADTFDDVFCGGAEDEVTLSAHFPVGDIEVTKEARCVDEPATDFRHAIQATPGSEVEFRIGIQNWGNRDLDVSMDDMLSCIPPAVAALVPQSCGVQLSPKDFPTVAFCQAFESAMTTQNGFPLEVGRLKADSMCAVGPGDQLVFTFRVAVGPIPSHPDLCDQAFDCINDVTVSGRVVERVEADPSLDLSVYDVDPILPADPLTPDSPNGNAEEEFCIDAACCATVPVCIPQEVCHNGICVQVGCADAVCLAGDTVGDVRDEFTVTVVDRPGVSDTMREMAGGGDDNRVQIELECRDVALTKQVRLLPNGAFQTGTTRMDIPAAPSDVEYRYTVVNGGEVDESVTLRDNDLCADVSAVAGAFPGQISFLNCPLCVPPTPGELVQTVAANGGQFVTSCIIRISTEAALRSFTRQDDDRPECQAVNKAGAPDVLCYRNCADVSAIATNLEAEGVCPDGEITSESFATVCHPICDIDVRKQVRCLDNCTEKNPVGQEMTVLEAAQGSCVEFVVDIENTSTDINLCLLRIVDQLSDQTSCIVFEDSVRFAVDGVVCGSVPAGFNVNGNPFDWSPVTNCGRPSLFPGEVLTITFNAEIPLTASPTCSPDNTVSAQGAAFCPAGAAPGFTCNDNSQATVEVLQPSLECLSKEWAFQWDSDGDCEPEAPFTAFAQDIDLRDKVFPALLRLQIRAENTGEVPLDVTAEDDDLVDCVNALAGVSFVTPPTCELGTTKLLMPAAIGIWSCDIRVETAEAMRALDGCDGSADGVYENHATVSGRLVSATTDICVPEERIIVGFEDGDNCEATILVPEPCDLEVVKDVKCADDPVNAFAVEVDALPGARLTYRMRITNTSPRVKLPRVCLDDELSCNEWFVPRSISAIIGATNVTNCVATGLAAGLASGSRQCFTFASCRPAAPWIAPGETLTITFDVDVPDDFDIVGTNPDCTNEVTVEGFSEVCVRPPLVDEPCSMDSSEAQFDVLIPALECSKDVRADVGGNGTFDTEFLNDLSLPCDILFPVILEYRFTVRNTGETPLRDVMACDPDLLADAVAAGLTVGACQISGTPDGCGTLVALAVGQSTTATCRITVSTRTAWENFAARDTDGGEDCYSNTSSANANVNTTLICDAGANVRVFSEGCSARVCLQPQCQIAVTKQVRCLDNCDEENPIGGFMDVLQAAPGSCVEFEVNVTNTSADLPVCRLRIRDTLNNQPANIDFDGSVGFRVGATNCPTPAGFNVTGAAFDWDPTTCGLAGLAPGATLTITFNATIPLNADPAANPTNAVVVDGAPTCPANGPNFCCQGTADAVVDILRPSVTCLSKEWAVRSDADGDCDADDNFGPFTSNLDLRERVFPAVLRLKVAAQNNGEVPLNAVVSDAGLSGCVNATTGVDFFGPPASCELGASKLLTPGQSAMWTCDILVESAEAMRDLANCDGVADGVYSNTANVTGTLFAAGTTICVPENRIINGVQTCSATVIAPEPCQLDVIKQVKCGDEPDLAYATDIDVLPGSGQRFRIRITNTSARTKIPRVCIRDLLSCCAFFTPGSIAADINGANVTTCVAPLLAGSVCSGDPECYTFAACRPAAPWIAPGETLTITFDVRVPPTYLKDHDGDCTNAVTVDGFSEVCAQPSLPDEPCDTDDSSASFVILLPSLECNKQVRADIGNNGTFDTPLTNALSLPCDLTFPVRLEYRFDVTNTGETPLINVMVCDPQLRTDAAAAGLTVGPCVVSTNPDGCGALPVLAVGGSTSGTCQITIPTRAGWENFAGRDTDNDRDCYTNESTGKADVNAASICDFAADPGVDSEPCEASICLQPTCQIEVTKRVRCLDDCAAGNPVENFMDSLQVAPGSCVEFEVGVTNTSPDRPICRLRIRDTLSSQPNHIAFGSAVRFRVGNTDCPVPAGFNVNGNPFEWDPTTCGLSGLGGQQTLLITFRASVPLTADPNVSPINTVIVDGAPTCPAIAPNFCCTDTEDAAIDILRPRLTCDSKQWSFQWDRNGDCQPDGTQSPFASEADLRDVVFPAMLQLRIQASNTGQVPLDVTARDDALLACASSTPGISIVNPASCELGVSKLIAPGGSATWSCTIRIETANAARNLDECDGVVDGIYNNTASVRGLMGAGNTGICVPRNVEVSGDSTCSARVRVPQECETQVTKTVQCLSGCTNGATSGSAGESLEVVPGAFARFAINIENTSPLVKIPRICLDDAISCADWVCPGSASVTLAGTNVGSNFAAFQPDGQKRCFTFGARPAAPWIAPGETLTLTFDVQVPPNFNISGVNPDCTNDVTVESFTEVCVPPQQKPCDTQHDTASIDVKTPRLICRKTVAADFGNDGTTDVAANTSINLSNPTFPLRLIYSFVAENTGDTLLADVMLCDDELVRDAHAAGIAIVSCTLCNGAVCDGADDSCRLVGPLAPQGMGVATCHLVVEDENQWADFAGLDQGLDNRSDCYANRAQSTGRVSGVCAPAGFGLIASDPCEATVCVSIVRQCPVTKANFDIWNQNEFRFSGTERCIESWDQTLLSRYTNGGPANHFMRDTLQTDKGRARINGIASPAVCTADSINAPLIGVAAKILNFGRDGIEWAGVNLVGSGDEVGVIQYQPTPGRSVQDAPTATDLKSAGFRESRPIATSELPPQVGLTRASNSEKGSLLVYPKVEIKWNAQGQLIQDTFVGITNDFAGSVRVQLYFINGDRATDPVLAGDPPVEIERAHPGCNWVDNRILLTANEPTYWSAATGLPKGVSPWSILDPGVPPGRPDRDPRNPGGRVVRGYILAWAVDVESQEIRWNHLTGQSTIINYADTSAWDYNAWSFQAITGATNGSLLSTPYGRLDLDGSEYDTAPNTLHLDFYTSGSAIGSGAGTGVLIDTDLTLWAAVKDLRNP